MLIIVGSGRCGTKSAAEGLNGIHEPNMDPSVFLASAVSHGWMPEDEARKIMDSFEWPDVFSDYKQSELIGVTSVLWPEAQYLWMVRNPADTVASMVANNWYRPSDDWYPAGYLSWYGRWEDRTANVTAFNHAGNRTRGDYVGDFNLSEWSNLGQVERCGWWWNWVNRRIMELLLPLGERWRMERVEDQDMPRANESATVPVSGWEPYTEEMSAVLGYG